MPKPPPDRHPADVKAALEKKGQTLSALSVARGYDRSAAGKALRSPWPAVERIIAASLGVPPKKIWPSRYDAAGAPLREGRWTQHSKTAAPGHRQKRAAAAAKRRPPIARSSR